MACKKCGKMKCSCGGMVNKKPVKKAMGGMVYGKDKPRVGGQPGGPRFSDTGPYAGGAGRKERPKVERKPVGSVRPVSPQRQAMMDWRAKRPQRPAGATNWGKSQAMMDWRAQRPQRPMGPGRGRTFRT